VCETTQPINIREEEELQRLAALQQRDHIVRNSGLTDHLHKMLSVVPSPIHLDHVTAQEESKASATAITLDILDKELMSSLSKSCPPQTMLLSSVHPSQLPGYSPLGCYPRYGRHPIQGHPLAIQRGLSNDSNSYSKHINYRHSAQPDPGGTGRNSSSSRQNNKSKNEYYQQPEIQRYHLPLCHETFGLSIVSAPTQLSRVNQVATTRQLLDTTTRLLDVKLVLYIHQQYHLSIAAGTISLSYSEVLAMSKN